MKRTHLLALAAGLMLLAQGAARAQTYTIQPIAKFGDKVGDLTIKVDTGDFELFGLNDAGQVGFVTERDPTGEMLVQFADGKLTAIAVPGGDAPGGKWPDGLGFGAPLHMNQAGNIVFVAGEGTTFSGSYLWDFQAKQVKQISKAGMPAANVTLEDGAGYGFGGVAINNNNDIAFNGGVKNAAGAVISSLFFLGRDNKIVPIALPDQDLFGAKMNRTRFPEINDAGLVAFHGRREGDTTDSGYLWENGTITQIALQGQDAGDGHKIVRVAGLRLNNANRNVLVGARLDDIDAGPWALYLFADGKLKPVVTPGMAMPGGGTFKTIPTSQAPIYGLSAANNAGQAAFVAQLDDDTTGVYLMNADGTLAKVLKSGETTSLGKIVNVGEGNGDPAPSVGIAFNNKGQIAVTLLPENGDPILALLTPAAQ